MLVSFLDKRVHHIVHIGSSVRVYKIKYLNNCKTHKAYHLHSISQRRALHIGQFGARIAGECIC